MDEMIFFFVKQYSSIMATQMLIQNSSSAEMSDHKSDEACAICMCTIDSGDRDILACGHEFCSGCITHWLDANTNCPLCRADPVLTRLGQSDMSNVRINMTGFDYYIPRQLELSGAYISPWLEEQKRAEMARADLVEARECLDLFQSAMQRNNSETLEGWFHAVGSDHSHFVDYVAHLEEELDNLIAMGWDREVRVNWVKIAKDEVNVLQQHREQFLINNADKDTTQNVYITREKLAGGKQYFIVHPDFDVPECPGGDPRTRGIRRATCTNSRCPCVSFVAKILIFEGQFVHYQPEDMQPYQRLYKGQGCIINEGRADEHMVYAQGAILRSQIAEWSHATIPVKRQLDFSHIIVPPRDPADLPQQPSPSVPRAPPQQGCPFAIGERVMKLRGVGAYEEGIVAFINEEGTKIRVEKASGDGTWHLQRFSNYCVSGFT